jgi:hypothetical protein
VAGVSLERALCAVDVPVEPAASDAPIDTESGSTVIGGTPAMPRIELSSARFSARNRATSASSARVYRVAVIFRQTV